ncbi:Discontinuous actin hexagon [Strongyloides ratti]|uniref:Discontinuous actin hexagon n=1 Tax=Strongyloides ratti TaxID=34506 RepID=A0A090MZ51_STRRB|nr:Discontinuous actin hexagon [Strongyloides ratti]CEF68324.1 Discontinuous actin hexagon [Strongyloides ratti]
MLFSGGASGSSKPKKDDRKEKKVDKNERYEIQEQVFSRWCSWLIEGSNVESFKDIGDHKFLIKLGEYISGKSIPFSNHRHQDIDNVFTTLIPDQEDKIYQISITEVIEGVPKTVSSMFWQLIQIYWKEFAPPGMNELKLSDAIKNWCLEACSRYDEITISDFTSSWRDGIALNALIASYDPTLIDMDEIRGMKGDERIENAINIAKYKLNVPKLLTTKDFHSEYLDNRSVVLYLMTLYLCLVKETSQESIEKQSKKSSDIRSNEIKMISPETANALQNFNQNIQMTNEEQQQMHQEQINQLSSDNQQSSHVTNKESSDLQPEHTVRSRKSSSSSQKSINKRRMKKYEEQLKDYESCLEQVLAWLLDAEEELNNMGYVSTTDVEKLKEQFKQHEQFMLSLTQSQDSVGKVLARGQHLSQKLEEEQCSAVISQLLIVNQRWETVREKAMERQTELQSNLNSLQLEQLNEISRWLDDMEEMIKNRQNISNDISEIEMEIKDHEDIQEMISVQQSNIEKLSTFVAVIDVDSDSSDEAKYDILEKRLHEVGQRWITICEWAENRANALDGLVELQIEYREELEGLGKWLTIKEVELGLLKSTDFLKTDEDVKQQLKLLQKIETDLEEEHSNFVKLSQLCMELVSKYDKTNISEANKIKKDLDLITSRWDNIVTRLEEHSQTLIKSGKTGELQLQPLNLENEKNLLDSNLGTTIQFPSMEMSYCITTSPSSEEKPKKEEEELPQTEMNIVDEFVHMVGELNDDIQPLYDWQRTFTMNLTPETLPIMIQICQKKLNEIKAAELKVEKLQNKLLAIEDEGLSQENFQIVNDVFDNFMKKWSSIVKKISECLGILTEKNIDLEKSAQIASNLDNWLTKIESVLNEITKIPEPDQRIHRLKKIADQLDSQEKNLVYLQKTLPNSEKVKRLQHRMISILTSIQQYQQNESKATLNEWFSKMEQNLKTGDIFPGNVEYLNDELDKVERLTTEMLETKKRNTDNKELCDRIDKLVKSANSKKHIIIENINKTQQINYKYEKILEKSNELKCELDGLKKSNESLSVLEKQFKLLRDKISSESQTKDEIIELLNDINLKILRSHNSKKEELSSHFDEIIKNINENWNVLDLEIDEHLNCLVKEQRKICETELKNLKELVEKLEKCMNSSSDASDAEELSEFLDELEHLLEKIEKVSKQLNSVIPSENCSLKSEVEKFIVHKEAIIASANRRINTLQLAVNTCDKFESDLCKFQNWCTNVGHILSKRVSEDVYASDVPHEYKVGMIDGNLIEQIAKEFDDNQKFLKDLDTFIEKSKSQFQSNDRLRVLLEHSTSQLNELKTKFEEFKKPVMFNNSVNRILRRLSDIGSTVDDLTCCSVDDMEYNLNHCQQLVIELQEMEKELEELNNKKQNLIDCETVSEDEAKGLEHKFDYARNCCKLHIERCEMAEHKLIKCKEYVEKIDFEKRSVDKILKDIENPVLSITAGEIKNLLIEAKKSIDKIDEFNCLIIDNGFKSNINFDDILERYGNVQKSFDADCFEQEKMDIDNWDALLDRVIEYKDEINSFLNSLKDVEGIDLRKALFNQRELKNLYNDKVTFLMHVKPELSDKLLLEMNEINNRWNSLEHKINIEDSPVPSKILRCNSDSSEEGIVSIAMEYSEVPKLIENDTEFYSDDENVRKMPFQEKVSKLNEVFKQAEESLNFQKYPIKDFVDWKERVDNFNKWLDKWNPTVNEVLDEGRQLAENGRSELDVHDALDKLDNVVEMSSNIKETLEENEENLNNMLDDWEIYETEIKELSENVEKLKNNEIDNIVKAKETQEKLNKFVKKVEDMNTQWFKMQKNLPGNEDRIGEERRIQIIKQDIFDIGEQIKNFINLEIRNKESSIEKCDKQTKDTSSLGLSLNMDVCESDDDDGSIHLTSHLSPDGNIIKLYSNLNNIEEYFNEPEILPYDGLEEKAMKLQAIAIKLGESEGFVEANQMTMDISESDEAMRRIKNLKLKLEKRKRQIAERSAILLSLKSLIGQTENVITNHLLRVVKSDDGREDTPDLNELEEEQNECDSALAKSAVLLRQCENKVGPILDQLSEKDKQNIKSQLERLKQNFLSSEEIVKKKRGKLENRLSDETKLFGILETLEFWCEECKSYLSIMPNPLDEEDLANTKNKIEQLSSEYEEKLATFHNLENLKNRFVALDCVNNDIKHKMRRDVSNIGTKITDLQLNFRASLTQLETLFVECREYSIKYEEIKNWLDIVKNNLENAETAKIYTPNMHEFLKYQKENKEFICPKLKILENKWNDVKKKINDTTMINMTNNNFDDLQLQYNMIIENLNCFVHLHIQEKDDSPANNDEAYHHQLLSAISEADENKFSHSNVPNSQNDNIDNDNTTTVVQQQEIIELPMTNSSYSLKTNESKDLYKSKFSVREMAMLDTIMNIRHWINETERNASITVDITDQIKQKELIDKIQNFIDELKVRQLESLRIFDTSTEQEIKEKAELCQADINRITGQCQRRKNQLKEMIDSSRTWDIIRSNVEAWLIEGNDLLNNSPNVNELSDIALKEQLRAVDITIDQLKEYKQKMKKVNKMSDDLLDNYKIDDGHNLSHIISKLNTKWNKFNDNIRVRKAVLESSIRSRNDFQSALESFEKWLNENEEKVGNLYIETESSQRLKSCVKRKELLKKENECDIGIQGNQEVISSLRQIGFKIIGSLDDDKEKVLLREKLEDFEERWQKLIKHHSIIKERLEAAQEESEKLTNNLSDLLYWIEEKNVILNKEQPIGGELALVIKQSEVVKNINREIEGREMKVTDTIELAYSFLMQHNLRPNLYTKSVLDNNNDPIDEKTETAEREERRIGLKILADCERLKTDWKNLKNKCNEWGKVVEEAHLEMQSLDRAMAESLLAISEIEAEIKKRKPVHELRLEQLKDGLIDNGILKRQIQEASIHIDDMNDAGGRIQASDIVITSGLRSQINAVNERYALLKREISIRQAALERAFEDFGPSSEHFLIESCQSPWQRAISKCNQLPYYINHDTEVTQWDHPVMVDVMEQVQTFNQVKFSAYRTAMKLRALQKRLCLDLIDMKQLDKAFAKITSTDIGEACGVELMVTSLVLIFEELAKIHPEKIRNVPMAVDLTINLMLNIFDGCRDGFMRLISFKIILIVFCKASLEDKYKYLFSLITTPNGVDPKRLAVLFYDLIHIPKYLGEAAAFGGSNIEPSVRSCFEHSKFPHTLNIDNFLQWLKKEPQSLVWLPVMHRLASAEYAKHQAKCNVCKMFPIIGLRYRCLHCFNFDMCQNCFFSQRTAKNHKLVHPMQEYCVPTTSGDDVRDFGFMMRNKIRGLKPKVGYLPVNTVDEGKPIENRQVVPNNPATENIHHRIYSFAQKLSKNDDSGSKIECNIEEKNLNDNEHEYIGMDDSVVLNWKRDTERKSDDVKSPIQLINQVDQMHKEELDQVLHKLQLENIELKRELEKKRQVSNLRSTPNISQIGRGVYGSGYKQYNTFGRYESSKRNDRNLSNGSLPPVVPLHQSKGSYDGYGNHMRRSGSVVTQGSLFSNQKMNQHASLQNVDPPNISDEQALIEEARTLRLHKHRLEQRSKVLEEQNKQLETQLDRIRKMITTRKSTEPQLSSPMLDNLQNPYECRDMNALTTDDEESCDNGLRKNRMEALIGTCDELGRAMQNLVYNVVATEATDEDIDENEDIINGN